MSVLNFKRQCSLYTVEGVEGGTNQFRTGEPHIVVVESKHVLVEHRWSIPEKLTVTPEIGKQGKFQLCDLGVGC